VSEKRKRCEAREESGQAKRASVGEGRKFFFSRGRRTGCNGTIFLSGRDGGEEGGKESKAEEGIELNTSG